MASGPKDRLSKLEQAAGVGGRVFMMWQDGDRDAAAEKRFREERGMSDRDRLVVGSWLAGGTCEKLEAEARRIAESVQ